MRYRILLYCISLIFSLNIPCLAQTPEELEYRLDLNSPTVSIPRIYKPSIDLSGRGMHRDVTKPQTLAAKAALDNWQADLGFGNFYRIQYNLWEIQQLANDKPTQGKLLESSYEEIIKKISDSGGTVILDLFGTPDGMGRVLDKNSPPHNLKAYKELVKSTIRKLSCEKKYNVWYEVWNAPDEEDFFLGQRSEYLGLYRIVGEAVKELRQEAKMHIPLGGPSVSSWFRNIEPNNMLSPERSLIYELIKYCYSYRLPLDFISWHAYSSDPQEEKQDTIYNKPPAKLIREWLSYFRFDKNIPLVIDEWNFDGPANILSERGKNAYIAASYIPARLKHMYEAKIDYQTYFCLEDFGGNKAGANRNLGVFSFDILRPDSKSYAKAGYNVFRMLGLLGQELFTTGISDEFVGVIATKSQEYYAILIYNYIDPQAAMNYLSRNIVYLNSAERKAVLNIIKSDRMEKIISGTLDIAPLRLSAKSKGMFSRAVDLNSLVKRFSKEKRKIKVSLKGPKDIYLLTRYTVDSNCSRDCEFKPAPEKEVDFSQGYNESIELSPYSVQLLVFKKKPHVIESPLLISSVGSKPETVQPEVKLEAKPEKKPEIKPEAKAESKVEAKPEIKPEAKAESKVEAKPEIKPEAKAILKEDKGAESK
ncbi:MAG: hypothetical protein PHI07_02745 [Candidatus Omnitrophica bacterium]|nr:hypothetical protein [Candidatus Omnitrophota bacterium]